MTCDDVVTVVVGGRGSDRVPVMSLTMVSYLYLIEYTSRQVESVCS